MTHGHLYEQAANDLAILDELGLHLMWASRVKADSPSRKRLRKMFERPEVLDLIERLVAEERAVLHGR